jgi:hypothetical protein
MMLENAQVVGKDAYIVNLLSSGIRQLAVMELEKLNRCKSSDFIKIENLKLSLLYNTHKQC